MNDVDEIAQQATRLLKVSATPAPANPRAPELARAAAALLGVPIAAVGSSARATAPPRTMSAFERQRQGDAVVPAQSENLMTKLRRWFGGEKP